MVLLLRLRMRTRPFRLGLSLDSSTQKTMFFSFMSTKRAGNMTVHGALARICVGQNVSTAESQNERESIIYVESLRLHFIRLRPESRE